MKKAKTNTQHALRGNPGYFERLTQGFIICCLIIISSLPETIAGVLFHSLRFTTRHLGCDHQRPSTRPVSVVHSVPTPRSAPRDRHRHHTKQCSRHRTTFQVLRSPFVHLRSSDARRNHPSGHLTLVNARRYPYTRHPYIRYLPSSGRRFPWQPIRAPRFPCTIPNLTSRQNLGQRPGASLLLEVRKPTRSNFVQFRSTSGTLVYNTTILPNLHFVQYICVRTDEFQSFQYIKPPLPLQNPTSCQQPCTTKGQHARAGRAALKLTSQTGQTNPADTTWGQTQPVRYHYLLYSTVHKDDRPPASPRGEQNAGGRVLWEMIQGGGGRRVH